VHDGFFRLQWKLHKNLGCLHYEISSNPLEGIQFHYYFSLYVSATAKIPSFVPVPHGVHWSAARLVLHDVLVLLQIRPVVLTK
jgi:hypothetical protein